jgi:hypothetical protein
MAVVDVNGDGYKDIVLSNRAAPDGNGTFTVWLYNPTLNGYGIIPDAVVKVPRHRRMIVDDLNKDNRLDVVILTEQPTWNCSSVIPRVLATARLTSPQAILAGASRGRISLFYIPTTPQSMTPSVLPHITQHPPTRRSPIQRATPE